MLIEINTEDIDIFLEQNDFSLILFKTPTCRICASLSDILELLEEELDFRIKIGVVDVTRDASVLDKFNLTSIPTLLLNKGGNIDKKSGSMSLEELLSWTNKYMI